MQIVYPRGGFMWDTGNVCTTAAHEGRGRGPPVRAPEGLRVLRAHQVDESVAPDAAGPLGTRDAWLALGGILALAAAAWAYTAHTAAMDAGAMAPDAGCRVGRGGACGAVRHVGGHDDGHDGAACDAGLPALPLGDAAAARRGARCRSPAAFVAGYLAIWAGFSVLAALAQYALHAAALLSPDAMRVTPPIAGALLIAAGCWQWTPMKRACLAHCRSPLQFLTTAWREGIGGAFSMGARHGLWCLGCCWLLMTLCSWRV